MLKHRSPKLLRSICFMQWLGRSHRAWHSLYRAFRRPLCSSQAVGWKQQYTKVRTWVCWLQLGSIRFRGLTWYPAVDIGDTLLCQNYWNYQLLMNAACVVPQYQVLLPSADRSGASLAVRPPDHCDESRNVASWAEVHLRGSSQCCVHLGTFARGSLHGSPLNKALCQGEFTH